MRRRRRGRMFQVFEMKYADPNMYRKLKRCLYCGEMEITYRCGECGDEFCTGCLYKGNTNPPICISCAEELPVCRYCDEIILSEDMVRCRVCQDIVHGQCMVNGRCMKCHGG